jgi:hypothetical protein
MSERDEFEERRIIRAFASAAREIPPLAPEEVSDLLNEATAATTGRSRRSPHLPQLGRLLAIAAAVVVAVGLGAIASESRHSSREPAGPTARVASFPEGTALHLLLSAGATDRAS